MSSISDSDKFDWMPVLYCIFIFSFCLNWGFISWKYYPVNNLITVSVFYAEIYDPNKKIIVPGHKEEGLFVLVFICISTSCNKAHGQSMQKIQDSLAWLVTIWFGLKCLDTGSKDWNIYSAAKWIFCN